MAGRQPLAMRWSRVAAGWLPFADAATRDLPMARLLRLSLFQVSVGMTTVLLNGTLNRVMVVELGVPTSLVALMISLPLVFAPLRVLIGHRSDNHRSKLGWRRVPYIWFGTLLQFGGLAIMPFALNLLTRPDVFNLGVASSALAFLLAGAGFHTVQTAGLALVTDLAPEEARPRAVALHYVTLLIGMMITALLISRALVDFTPTHLVQVISTAALASVVLNLTALWKQEARRPVRPGEVMDQPSLGEVWRQIVGQPGTARLLTAVGIGAAGFAMQDALLEPFGGLVLGMSVSGTTALTGLWALGSLAGFTLAGRWLADGWDPHRAAGYGGVVGIASLLLVLLTVPLDSPGLLFAGAIGIGLGSGLFLVGTLTAAMALARSGKSGLALGAWGAVQATGAGVAIAVGGIGRDLISAVAVHGGLGGTLALPATGYGVIYVVEILLLLVMLVLLGPLVRAEDTTAHARRFGLSQFPS